MNMAEISLKLAPVGPMAHYLWIKPRSETNQLKLLTHFLQPGRVFFDVGADAGLFAIAVAKTIGPSGVYAFEPSNERFQLLRRNLDLNGLTNLHAVSTLLGDHVSGPVLRADSHGDGACRVGVPTAPNGSPAQQGTTPITTLDAFVESNMIPKVDVMRVDVGGAELPVLMGSKKLLGRSDAPVVLFETCSANTSRFGYHPVEILWFLADCGYQFYVLHPQDGHTTPHQPNGQYDASMVAVKSLHTSRLKSAENSF